MGGLDTDAGEVVAYSSTVTTNSDITYNMQFSWDPPGFSSGYLGPVYSFSAPALPTPSPNCLQEGLQTVAAAAAAIYGWLQTAAGLAYKKIVSSAFAEYGAGELSAEGFLMACLAALGAPEVVAALAWGGIALGVAGVLLALNGYLRCKYGWV